MMSRSTRFALAALGTLGFCGLGAFWGGMSIAADADSPAVGVVAPPPSEEVDLPAVPKTQDLAAPFGGSCSEECETSLSMLSDGDREGLIDLPARVQRTLAAIGPIKGDGGTKAAAEVARRLTDTDATGTVAQPGAEQTLAAPIDVQTGEADCTLRWFGFMDETVKTVGTHRCRIGKAADGTVTIEKLTGERMLVHLAPLNDRFSAYLGRSFLPEQAEREYDLKTPLNAGNGNFGNVSGLATLSGGQIVLIGGAELGMSPADDTFFSVLTISGS
ncbi:hypothetical protein [Aureimonas sp. AU20]|uniref:hypothetical protein n=1 Tax=Aureimonas sp. AU20 TaxID=1349819 RepID=UPI000722A987|nr:hypothetical protein [Aureimonas sp. AU20]ALN72856.1 hypothetical protein M673_09020 [Aureimonas sp. AU20]